MYLETGEPFSKKVSMSISSVISEEDKGFGTGYKSQVENVIIGKHMP